MVVRTRICSAAAALAPSGSGGGTATDPGCPAEGSGAWTGVCGHRCPPQPCLGTPCRWPGGWAQFPVGHESAPGQHRGCGAEALVATTRSHQPAATPAAACPHPCRGAHGGGGIPIGGPRSHGPPGLAQAFGPRPSPQQDALGAGGSDRCGGRAGSGLPLPFARRALTGSRNWIGAPVFSWLFRCCCLPGPAR